MRARIGLGKIDLHALLHQRRRDHEDDQQHEHHVDERRDVDLGEVVGVEPLPLIRLASSIAIG